MTQKNTDLKEIKDLVEVMKENDLVEIEINHGEDKILLKRSHPQQTTVTTVPMVGAHVPAVAADLNPAEISQAPTTEKAEQDDLIEIPSPMVGTFYKTPSPDSDPFVEIGSRINNQSVVCIIEAMKVMNEIKAETSGTIVEILLENGQAVEYGQALFKVKPD